MSNYTHIIIGSGYAGAVAARILSEKENTNILVLEKRPHIGGCMYDYYNEDGILVHKYGPHISVMDSEKCFNFLSRFTKWLPYEHKVKAEIDGIEVPLPINFNSLIALFGKEKGLELIALLLNEFAPNENVPILKMRESQNEKIKELADYIYEKVFLHYTMKMWGLSPTEIDPSVTARIPVRLSFDDRHFLKPFQVMPKDGFTKLFKNMLRAKNIEIRLNTQAKDVLSLDEEKGLIYFEDKIFRGKLIYTGALDELFSYQFGTLPYRSLSFEIENHNVDYIQDATVTNYPDSRPETRRTEMKRLTGQIKNGMTTTITEYPGEYKKGDMEFGEPFYAIANENCRRLHQKYVSLSQNFNNLYTVGRLADYKYYNMEDTILRSMDFCERLES